MMQRQDYNRFVKVVGNIHRHLHRTFEGKIAATILDEVVDTAQAQIALACAEDNPKFNSFQFDTSCRKERELPWR